MAESSVSVVALLRGINVGGKNRLAMADLRAIAVEAGYDDPSTYVQSGNVVLPHVATGRVPDVAATMRDAIHQSTGLDVVVVTRTGPEWTAVIEANPFEDVDDGTKLHVTFFTDPITDAIRRIDATPFEPERVVFGHRELYMSLPYGAGRSKLAVSLTRADRAGAGTARNWNTLEAIAELLATGVDQ